MIHNALSYRQRLTLMQGTLRALNRRAELLRLIKWARSKSLVGPEQLYKQRLQETDSKLLICRMRSKRVWRLAKVFHGLSCLVSPTPRYFKKGAASHYGYKNNKRRKVKYAQ